MPVVYVGGPFRGKSSWEMEQNIRRAETLALEVWRLGLACLCPHTNTRFFQGAAQDSVWLSGDLAMLARCDVFLVTEDWNRSGGTKAEIKFCEEMGIPVVYSIEELKSYLENSDIWRF